MFVDFDGYFGALRVICHYRLKFCCRRPPPSRVLIDKSIVCGGNRMRKAAFYAPGLPGYFAAGTAVYFFNINFF